MKTLVELAPGPLLKRGACELNLLLELHMPTAAALLFQICFNAATIITKADFRASQQQRQVQASGPQHYQQHQSDFIQ